MKGYRGMWMAAGLAAALGLIAVRPARAADTADPTIAKGSQWLALRAGYAKNAADYAPNGMVGYGLGYRRFVLDRWAVSAFLHHDLLGRFAGQAEIEVPMTLEVTRHTRWGSAFYPYLGAGAGVFYRKYYRTPADFSAFQVGQYVTVGASTPVRKAGLLGVDVRMAFLDRPANTVYNTHVDFPVDELAREVDVYPFNFKLKNEVHWSIKLDYSIVY